MALIIIVMVSLLIIPANATTERTIPNKTQNEILE